MNNIENISCIEKKSMVQCMWAVITALLLVYLRYYIAHYLPCAIMIDGFKMPVELKKHPTVIINRHLYD